MSDGQRRFDRRTLLKATLAASATWAGWNIPSNLGLDPVAAEGLFLATTASEATVAASFPQSVASGDPQPRGIVLWTRIAPVGNATSAPVAYEIASDLAFRNIVLRGVVDATAANDWTVKTQIRSTRLQPFMTHYYRFIRNGVRSRVGRFKTLPAATADLRRLRFAYISCQDYTNGFYTALPHLAREQVDFVVHLGDYIYETVDDPSFQGAQVRTIDLPSGGTRAETLADYRHLYKTYKADRNLQLVHERFAFINIWDDHEFANDAYQEYDTDTTDEAGNFAPRRRRAANRAWAEYTSAGLWFDSSQSATESLTIYRSFVFGRLAELVMTDERLYRDGPPCGLETADRYLTTGCAEMFTPGRTMLGTEQRDWFLDRMVGSTRTWKVWGNQVMVMQLKILQSIAAQFLPVPPNGDVYFTLDQWDGYPGERAAILGDLRAAGVRNLVTITGDIHTFIAGHQKVDFNDPLEEPVATCFVCGSVTSSNLSELATLGEGGLPVPPIADVTAAVLVSNPHIRYLNSSGHGYNVVVLTPTAMTVTMKSVETIREPESDIVTLKVFRVRRNQTTIEDITPAL